jgi:Protein of unknown function (DUF2778)
MTYGSGSHFDSKARDFGNSSRTARARRLFGAVGLTCVALACAGYLYVDLARTNDDPAINLAGPIGDTVADETVETDVPGSLLFDSRYALGVRPAPFSDDAPGELTFRFAAPPSREAAATPESAQRPPPRMRRLVQTVAVPNPRPPELRLSQGPDAPLRPAARLRKAPAAPADDKPTIFERLFGRPKAAGTTLAYAAPDGGVLNDGQSVTSGRLAQYDRYTAVYDISAHAVYMPDGRKLEAHSGLGDRLDDPRYVHERMRGPTPPHVYDLVLRERLFHGVRAIRLIPAGDRNPYGRTGLLAHTYMLGPNGDSNGCVSFRDYDAFLRAFMNQEIKRLVVVARAS